MLKSTIRTLLDLLTRVGKVETSVLITIGLTGLSLYLFVELADDMLEGDTREFDTMVLLAFRETSDVSNPVGPPWVEQLMRDITALGSTWVLATITLSVVGFLVLVHKHGVAWMIILSVTLGVAMSHLLKWGFARPRPDLVPHGIMVYTQSFPSGHAMLSAVVYLTLGALLARTQTEPRVKLYLLGIAAALTVLVGLSRIDLGVHWPTDVLAGWTIGAGWSFFCWLIMLWLQSKGKVSREGA